MRTYSLVCFTELIDVDIMIDVNDSLPCNGVDELLFYSSKYINRQYNIIKYIAK